MVRIRRGFVWWPLLIILGWCAGLQGKREFCYINMCQNVGYSYSDDTSTLTSPVCRIQCTSSYYTVTPVSAQQYGLTKACYGSIQYFCFLISYSSISELKIHRAVILLVTLYMHEK